MKKTCFAFRKTIFILHKKNCHHCYLVDNVCIFKCSKLWFTSANNMYLIRHVQLNSSNTTSFFPLQVSAGPVSVVQRQEWKKIHGNLMSVFGLVWCTGAEKKNVQSLTNRLDWRFSFTMFRTNYVENICLRCNKTVYPTDKIGPLKDFTFFHSGCFRCVECSTKLTLKTYFNNQVKENWVFVCCTNLSTFTCRHCKLAKYWLTTTKHDCWTYWVNVYNRKDSHMWGKKLCFD